MFFYLTLLLFVFIAFDVAATVAPVSSDIASALFELVGYVRHTTYTPLVNSVVHIALILAPLFLVTHVVTLACKTLGGLSSRTIIVLASLVILYEQVSTVVYERPTILCITPAPMLTSAPDVAIRMFMYPVSETYILWDSLLVLAISTSTSSNSFCHIFDTLVSCLGYCIAELILYSARAYTWHAVNLIITQFCPQVYISFFRGSNTASVAGDLVNNCIAGLGLIVAIYPAYFLAVKAGQPFIDSMLAGATKGTLFPAWAAAPLVATLWISRVRSNLNLSVTDFVDILKFVIRHVFRVYELLTREFPIGELGFGALGGWRLLSECFSISTVQSTIRFDLRVYRLVVDSTVAPLFGNMVAEYLSTAAYERAVLVLRIVLFTNLMVSPLAPGVVVLSLLCSIGLYRRVANACAAFSSAGSTAVDPVDSKTAPAVEPSHTLIQHSDESPQPANNLRLPLPQLPRTSSMLIPVKLRASAATDDHVRPIGPSRPAVDARAEPPNVKSTVLDSTDSVDRSTAPDVESKREPAEHTNAIAPRQATQPASDPLLNDQHIQSSKLITTSETPIIPAELHALIPTNDFDSSTDFSYSVISSVPGLSVYDATISSSASSMPCTSVEDCGYPKPPPISIKALVDIINDSLQGSSGSLFSAPVLASIHPTPTPAPVDDDISALINTFKGLKLDIDSQPAIAEIQRSPNRSLIAHKPDSRSRLGFSIATASVSASTSPAPADDDISALINTLDSFSLDLHSDPSPVEVRRPPKRSTIEHKAFPSSASPGPFFDPRTIPQYAGLDMVAFRLWWLVSTRSQKIDNRCWRDMMVGAGRVVSLSARK